ncbi:ADAT2 [Acrasis kona]|uniref:ADAT2 n=1 Tax=Acrasis kona TaxID=1008807 RepID=A0AAW2ZF67_9EUKA
MNEAMNMAKEALSLGEVPVGCVLVHNDTIIGRGCNATVRTRDGTRHAEFEAFDQVLQSGHPPSIFRECQLYVTVEPCIMCASALRLLQIESVFCGCMNDRFGGCGSVLPLHDCNVTEYRPYKCMKGTLEKEAIDILRHFYVQENPLAPQPLKKEKKRAKRAERLNKT